MQHEIDGANPAVNVRILGVNGIGYAEDNGLMTDGRALPWLQDETAESAWDKWRVQYRDVVVLDAQGHRVFTYNLTSNNLQESAAYDELKRLLLDQSQQAIRDH